MRQNKVADRVCPLDREGVLVVRLDEPGVLGSYELARGIVCPELYSRRQSSRIRTLFSEPQSHLELVVLVHIPALLDRFQPFFGYGLINVGLVYYFRDQLWTAFDQRRMRSWYLPTGDGIGVTGFGQESDECKDTSDQESNDQKIDNQEDQDAPPHLSRVLEGQTDTESLEGTSDRPRHLVWPRKCPTVSVDWTTEVQGKTSASFS